MNLLAEFILNRTRIKYQLSCFCYVFVAVRQFTLPNKSHLKRTKSLGVKLDVE